MILPTDFKERMKALLKNEYEIFIQSYDNPPLFGLRANNLKITADKLADILPFNVRPVSWAENGFYYDEVMRPAKSHYYNAGLYYIQEPSAMLPAEILDVLPGDRVLDLCAAPGGKATRLAEKLMGQGLLVANDISRSRTASLSRNLELFGVTNAAILSETPEKLSGRFPAFFDKILVDVPCSGEGMFRRNPASVNGWSRDESTRYSAIQLEILGYAAEMLAENGKMVYSTCTFSVEENEKVIERFLNSRPDFRLLHINHKNLGLSPGVGLSECGRIFPHRQDGEGHFVAYLERISGQTSNIRLAPFKPASGINCFYDFCDKYLTKAFNGNFLLHHDSLFITPEGLPALDGLRVVKSGFHVGDIKKERFTPSQHLAMALSADDFKNIINLKAGSESAEKYFRGESLYPEGVETMDGYCLVCIDGYPAGFGKINNGLIKNKYSKSWLVQ